MNDLAHPRLIVAIPLRSAALCAGCESVFVLGDWDHCPACSDGHFLPLEGIIGTTRNARPENETAGAMNAGQAQEGGGTR